MRIYILLLCYFIPLHWELMTIQSSLFRKHTFANFDKPKINFIARTMLDVCFM